MENPGLPADVGNHVDIMASGCDHHADRTRPWPAGERSITRKVTVPRRSRGTAWIRVRGVSASPGRCWSVGGDHVDGQLEDDAADQFDADVVLAGGLDRLIEHQVVTVDDRSGLLLDVAHDVRR